MDDLFPLLPFRTGLYTPDELFAGFSEADPQSYRHTLDFRTFRSTRLAPSSEVGMLRALHDQTITDRRTDFIDGKRVVALMGGHAMSRREAAYREVVHLTRALAREGALVVSGGGPGAMEATHLGAMLAGCDESMVGVALEVLGAVPDFPEAGGVVGAGGVIDERVVSDLHAWQVPAFRVRSMVAPHERGESLAVPTWFYGHEPSTPFASHLAKYFSNPLREDGLLAIALDGVIYAPGSAGTVQEIFQDTVQNVYRVFSGRFSPMAFLDTDGCWTERLPVLGLLRALVGEVDYAESVVVSDDPDVILGFLGACIR